MLRIKEHMTFILAALVFTVFSLPAQAGVSIRIGSLGYGQYYGYGFPSGINYYTGNRYYYAPSYYDRSSKYNRHNNHRNNHYNKHKPSTHVFGSYPFNSYKYRNQYRPSYSNNFGNSFRRGYEQGFTDGSKTRHRQRGNGVATKRLRR